MKVIARFANCADAVSIIILFHAEGRLCMQSRRISGHALRLQKIDLRYYHICACVWEAT